MSEVSEAIRGHHRELERMLTEQVTALVECRPEADPEALVAFLKNDLLPHAAGEEQHLYPSIARLLRAHGRATATMSVDHECIEGFVRQIDETAQALRDAGAADRLALEGRLRHLALQLQAVLQVHLEKEERIYLPLFEQYLSPEEQRWVLEGMHDAYGKAARDETRLLDARHAPQAERHPPSPRADAPQARPDRPVVAPLLQFRIEEQMERLKQEHAWLSGSRNAITLIKEPNLRVVLTVLRKGTTLHEHQTGGPLTLQVLSGSVSFRAPGHALEIGPGGLVVLESAIVHEVEALEESAFLLTLVQPPQQ